MKLRGHMKIKESDYKNIKLIGKDKKGNPVTITLENALNMSDIGWEFKEKDDVVAQITFTATYENTDSTSDSDVEPWTVEYDDGDTGAACIMLGACIVHINDTPVALCRGGGKFEVKREFRNQGADGDRGPVKGRIEIETSIATVTLNALTILENMQDFYVGVEVEG